MRSVVLPIIGINVIAFFLQMITGGVLTDLFLLDQARVWFEPWRLLTAMFLHGSLNHLFFNMFGLFIFGPILEERIGAKRFLYLYLGAGLFASLAAALLYPLSLGASGAIFGMLGALIMLLPRLQILFFFIIPMPLWVAGIVWVILDTIGLFFPTGIASAAHLAGMAVGLAVGYYIKKTEPVPVRITPGFRF
ncbi:MAG: rhomboid family intramembrane serine protease [Candidatus Woesearchaeota archaeon]